MLAWTWCLWDSTPFCVGWWFERLVLPAVIAFLVYFFAVQQLRKKRAIDFADKQLAEFYGPMVAARAEIFNHTKFDRYVRAASRYIHEQQLKRDEHRAVDEAYVREAEKAREELKKFFDALNERMFTETVEAFLSMRKLFAERMAYADTDTELWYDYFYAFVEMWVVLRKDEKGQFLPKGVSGTIGLMFDEGLLQPFYSHLKERARYLRTQISGRRAVKEPAPEPPSTETLELLDRAKSVKELIL